MSCASAPLLRTASFGLSNSPLERRLQAEWDLLQRLVDRNPGRLTALTADDLCFRLRLLGTPGFLLAEEEHVAAEHEVVLVFPRFFPAAPLECYLRTPVQHPNIHPETGFVCLWDRHRMSNTVEHALHKLVAMLGWKLYNREAIHVMQPEALARIEQAGGAVLEKLAADTLLGVTPAGEVVAAGTAGRERQLRRRLS